jgi:folate-binding protein YgfZ
MSQARYIALPHRGVLSVAGEERKTFLQGLVSNDVTKVAADRALWSAFLTPQGKFLHEFFMVEQGDALLLEGEAGRLDDLRKRLSLYKLRAKVTISLAEDLMVCAVLGDNLGLAEPGAARALANGVAFRDPRLAEAGVRVLLPRDGAEAALAGAGCEPGDSAAYERMRLTLGLPDGSRDMVVDKAILLENGFEELNGVDFHKGCYMGQELTARTKYRGLVKKRLMPVAIDGPAPEPGTLLMLGDTEAGEMRSAAGTVGLALVRVEALPKAGHGFTAGTARLLPQRPGWMVLPDQAP